MRTEFPDIDRLKAVLDAHRPLDLELIASIVRDSFRSCWHALGLPWEGGG